MSPTILQMKNSFMSWDHQHNPEYETQPRKTIVKFLLPEDRTSETKQIKILKLGKHVKVLEVVLMSSFVFSPEEMICSIQPLNITHFTAPNAIGRDFHEKLPRHKPTFQNRMQIIETTAK